MTDKKKKMFTFSDFATVIIIAAAVLLSLIPGAFVYKTARAVYTLRPAAPISAVIKPGDSVICTSGGLLGVVTGVNDGVITVEADVRIRSGVCYAGSTAITENAEYDISVNAYHMKGTVGDLTVTENEK